MHVIQRYCSTQFSLEKSILSNGNIQYFTEFALNIFVRHRCLSRFIVSISIVVFCEKKKGGGGGGGGGGGLVMWTLLGCAARKGPFLSPISVAKGLFLAEAP